MASFNFLIHRLVIFLFNNIRFKKKPKIIKDAARSNDFEIDNIYSYRKFEQSIQKHRFLVVTALIQV